MGRGGIYKLGMSTLAFVLFLGTSAFFMSTGIIYEREKQIAAQVFSLMQEVQKAQERYHEQEGAYSSDLLALDVYFENPYFRIGQLRPGESGSLTDSWSLTIKRADPVNPYRRYNVTFTEQGFNPNQSSIKDSLLSGVPY